MKTFKRIICIVLSVLLIISAAIVSAAAIDYEAGVYGDFEYYKVNNDFVYVNGYTGDGKSEVTVPDYIDGCPVVALEGDVFKNHTELKSVVLPDTLDSLAARSDTFKGCTSLENIYIPDGVRSILCSFSGCTSLKKINIPDSAVSIAWYCFEDSGIYNDQSNWDNGFFYVDNCLLKADGDYSGVYSVRPGTRLIGREAFAGCDNLTDVIFPESLKVISEYAFYFCSNLNMPLIPDGTTYIGNASFEDSKFFDEACRDGYAQLYSGNHLLFVGKEISGKYSVRPGTITIGASAFHICGDITEIDIPDSVKTIGYAAISYCKNLEKVVLGNGIETIDTAAFYLCPALKEINIPESVKAIEDNAFFDCSALKSVTIPKSCKKISRFAFGYIQDYSENADNKLQGFKIFCYKDTAGEKYAIDNRIDYELLKEPEVHSVKLNGLTLNYKESAKLQPSVNADDGAKCTVEYESLNPDIVSVDKNGNVYAAKKGTAKIKVSVTDENGNTVTDICSVTVKYTAVQWIIKILLFGWLWY